MRLIDADALKEYATGGVTSVGLLTLAEIDKAPTIDPESLRPQGKWILGVVEAGYCTPGGNRPWICSECGVVKSWRLDKPSEKYCGECGAKMKGGADNV